MIKFKGIQFSLLWVILFCTVVCLTACNGCKQNTQRTFNGNPVEVKLLRFEKDLFQLNPADAESSLKKLADTYGHFYFSFARDILAMREDKNDPMFIKPMTMVVGYEPFRKLQKNIDSVYGNMADIQVELSKAMGIYHAEFPKYRVPDFVTFLSEFGYANVTYDSLIGIGIDMYMNATHDKFYRALEFPEYMIKKLQKEYIVPNAIKAIAIGKYDEQTYKDKRFIAMMIYEGKIRYFTKALLPEVHDTIILGCSAKQLEWCKKNEAEIWTHYIEKELLYKNNPMAFIRYFNDGPFTSAEGVPAESAPGIGAYSGLQIVTKYMNLHPDVSLQKLMEDTDCDKILKLSKYRPERSN